jgi:hypothetical protein
MARLNDTEAIVRRMAPKDPSACPDAGKAITTRMAIPGVLQYAYDDERGDMAYCPRPEPSAGGEGLRSAVMALTGGQVPRKRGRGQE